MSPRWTISCGLRRAKERQRQLEALLKEVQEENRLFQESEERKKATIVEVLRDEMETMSSDRTAESREVTAEHSPSSPTRSLMTYAALLPSMREAGSADVTVEQAVAALSVTQPRALRGDLVSADRHGP